METAPLFFSFFSFQKVRKLEGIAAIAILLLVWQAITITSLIPSIFLPSPAQVLQALIKLLQSGELIIHVTASVFRVMSGFVLSAIIAIPLGIGIGLSNRWYRLLAPLLNITKYLPVVAFVPLTILWFGIGDESKIFLLALGTIPYLTSLTVTAVEHIPLPIIETAITLGATKRQLIHQVILPYAMPTILEALRVSMAIGWTYLTVAELVAAPNGLGYLIVQSQRYLRTDLIFAGILVIALLGLLTDQLFIQLRKKIVSWEGDALRENPNLL